MHRCDEKYFCVWHIRTVEQFSSIQDGIHALGKAHKSSQCCLWNSSNTGQIDDVPFSSLSRKIVERFLFLRLSLPPGDRWCGVFGFVPAGNVSRSSTLQIFRDATHLWWFLCPPVYLLCHFLWLWHVQDSTPCNWNLSGIIRREFHKINR